MRLIGVLYRRKLHSLRPFRLVFSIEKTFHIGPIPGTVSSRSGLGTSSVWTLRKQRQPIAQVQKTLRRCGRLFGGSRFQTESRTFCGELGITPCQLGPTLLEDDFSTMRYVWNASLTQRILCMRSGLARNWLIHGKFTSFNFSRPLLTAHPFST